MAGLQKTSEQLKRFKRAIRQGEPIGKALMAGGYSEKQARKGTALFKTSQRLASAYQQAVADLTKEVPPPEVRAKAIRNRLFNNIVEGEDKAVQSCKQLGQDKELDMFRPDSQLGVIYIEAPRLELPDMDHVSTIDATSQGIGITEGQE